MRTRVLSLLAGAVLLATPVSAVTIDWVPVGSPGNACEVQSQGCFGAVPAKYYISQYEVTNAQYAEFLNAKAQSDPNALYSASMSSNAQGGILQGGSDGSFVYTVKSDFANKPVNFVSFWDALRFTNWLHNGQGSGDTETGAYTLTPAGIAGNTVARNLGAIVFVPNVDEWYKAAYYDGLTATYFDYPTASNVLPVCAAPGATPNTANCNNVAGGVTDVGAYTSSASAYGTFDQGGNVYEWHEQAIGGLRGTRAGSWDFAVSNLGSGTANGASPQAENARIGFRVASLVPEPGTIVLVMAGLVGLSWKRRSS